MDCVTDNSEKQPSEKQSQKQVVDVVLVAEVQGESVIAGEEHDDICTRIIQAVLDHKAKYPFTKVSIYPIWNDDMDDKHRIDL